MRARCVTPPSLSTHTLSCLCACQVRDWARHALQLPPAVVDALHAESVSGQDFAEFVLNDGKALRKLLGAASRESKNKLLKAMQLALLG